MRYDQDEQAIRRLIASPDGPVIRHLSDLARQVTNAAKQECPVDTGNLRARHEFTVSVVGGQPEALIGSTADYALAVHEGGSSSSSASVGRRRVRVTTTTRGNPWLQRALARFGLTLTR